MRLRVLLPLLAGCDGVFGLTRVRDPLDGTTPTTDAAPTTCWRDEFGDGLIGLAARWDRIAENASCATTVENGQLGVMIEANTKCYAYVRTNQRYDMTGATAALRVVELTAAPTAETFFSLVVNDASYYFFNTNGGSLLMRMRIGPDELSVGSVSYDPVAHAYWRFRHRADVQELDFETSADGETWTPRHTTSTTALPVSSTVFEIGAGSYEVGNPALQARFDDFEMCMP